jgi:hypothetical protein
MECERVMRFADGNRAIGLVFWTLLGGVSLAGCGDGELKPPPLYPVTGTVTYQGKPVPGATVVFIPEGKFKAKDPARLRPFGTADEQGNYSIAWSEDHEGAAAGKYKVGISAVEAVDHGEGDSQKKPVNAIPDNYGNPAKSGLTATVTEDGENVFNFDLK